ncbi:MFS general substrate transporter [Ramicandelaber brevisporus]|nr:MFS general substrate transporter [Ramicandelaber brevisporus]
MPRLHFWLVMASLSLYTFLVLLDGTIVIAALPTICREFGTPVGSSISWVVSGCMLTMSVFQPIVGKLCDIVGSKRTFVALLLVFMVGTTLCGAATSFPMLLAARVIQGVGIAGGLMTAGSVAGAPLGGIVTDSIGWRWTFFVSLPVSAAALVLVLVFLRVPREDLDGISNLQLRWKQIDLVGALLFTSGATLLLLALSWGGGDFPWRSAPVVCCFVFSAVLMAAFVFWELRYAVDPFIPLGLFRDRNYVASCIIQCCTGAAMVAIVIYLTIYLQVMRGMAPKDASVLTIPVAVAASAGGGLHGLLYSFRKVYRGPAIFASIAGLVGIGVCLLWNPAHAVLTDASLAIILGTATGVTASATLISCCTTINDPSHLAPAIGFLEFSRAIGGSLGSAIATTAATNASISALAEMVGSDSALDVFNHGASSIANASPEDMALAEPAIMAGIRAAVVSMLPIMAIALVAACLMKHIDVPSSQKDAASSSQEETISPSQEDKFSP